MITRPDSSNPTGTVDPNVQVGGTTISRGLPVTGAETYLLVIVSAILLVGGILLSQQQGRRS